MNNRTYTTFGTVFGLILMLSTSPGSVQAAATTSARYEVEIVVFKHHSPDLEGNEIWSPDRANLNLNDLDKTTKAADSTEEETSIGKAVIALSEQDKYTVLTHKRWTQNAETKSTSPLKRITTEDGELDGTFVFYMRRFLHIEMKMLLKELDQKEGSEEGDAETTGGAEQILAYRIDESRRIRSKEIHYFDHPKFGVLVQITPKY